MTAVALSPEAGAAMRGRLNQWASHSGSQALLAAVAAVCAGALADAYPQAVLTRLNNLARRGIDTVTYEVVAAVRSLRERPLHRQATLRRVIDWAAGPDQQHDAGLRALAAISETRDLAELLLAELTGDAELQARLVSAFTLLFTGEGPQGEAREALFRWLDAAVEEPRYEDLIVDLMVRAGGAGPGASSRFARVSDLLYAWQPLAHDAQVPAARDLRDRCNERLHRANPLAAA